jgi:hypothetical protein
MTIEYWLALGSIIAPIMLMIYIERRMWQKYQWLVDYEAHVSAQKREILEAIRLIQYGAQEEGIELLQNSKLFED